MPNRLKVVFVAPSLRILGGPDQIANFYAYHDIHIQSPHIDNMPTSVVDAFASGLPVVSTVLTPERAAVAPASTVSESSR
jgi:hypothetical protein